MKIVVCDICKKKIKYGNSEETQVVLSLDVWVGERRFTGDWDLCEDCWRLVKDKLFSLLPPSMFYEIK